MKPELLFRLEGHALFLTDGNNETANTLKERTAQLADEASIEEERIVLLLMTNIWMKQLKDKLHGAQAER